MLLPGLGIGFAGRPMLGGPLILVALACVIVAVGWLPTFISPALMDTPTWPLQALFGAVWVAAAIAAQLVPVEWR